MEKPAGRTKGPQHRLSRRFHVGRNRPVHIVIGRNALVDHIHDGIAGDMAGGKKHLSPGIADPVIRRYHAGNIFLHEIGHRRNILEKRLQIRVAFQLPGGNGPHAAVGLDNDGISHLPGKDQSRLPVCYRGEAGAGNPRLTVVCLHPHLAFVLFNLVGFESGGDVEIRPQGRVQFQPVLVVALHPVDLPILARIVSHSPQHLVVILQTVHPVVFRQRPLQIRMQLIVGCVAHTQYIHAVFPQTDAEPAIRLRKIGGNKHKITHFQPLQFTTL